MKSAFPVPVPYHADGLTYREWLIGMALVGAASRDTFSTSTAREAIFLADAVLAQLAAEEPRS